MLGAGCHHDHCRGKGWRDLRLVFEPGAYDRQNGHAAGATTATGTAPSAARTEQPWPEPLAERAFHGLLGELVRAIEPHSEADPAALLAHALSGIGAMVDRHAHAIAGDAQHPAKLFTIIVGETSKGRKGSASRPIERILERTCDLMSTEVGGDWPRGDSPPRGNPEYDQPGLARNERFTGTAIEGLCSGEGLIHQVRDAVYKMEKTGKGKDVHYEEVLADPGVDDKRRWVVESEFASVLRVTERQGNTLAQIIRRAWDRDDLTTLVKNNPTRATGAHIAITGHVSRDEVLRYLNRTEIASGLANRFLWFASRRGRVLPRGGAVPDEEIDRIARRLVPVVAWAATARVLERDDEAADLWDKVYGPLSDGKPGLFGAVISRSEAQVLRISVLYAILDTSPVIRAEHLLAGLAVWRYCEASARWVFGDATGDPTADTILSALRRNGPMVRTEISDLFGRNLGKDRLDLALGLLLTNGLARCTRVETGGIRPAEQWSAS
jgi:hypothetical protein